MKQRTSYCGLVTKDFIGKEVALTGWVRTIRDHKKLLFIDLYDREGSVQIIFDESAIDKFSDIVRAITPESCIYIEGKVVEREASKKNPKLKSGDVEVTATDLKLLNKCDPLPFSLDDDAKVSEDIRLKYRYLDLRRDVMKKSLRARSDFLHSLRDYLVRNGFVDLETPYLIKYTPGGARNFLVPSRIHAGKAYALAESPQIFKQLYMLSGYDRYFQIAKCFRDEDLRNDRQPEFTQIDIEMSFLKEEDLFAIIENAMQKSIRQVLKKDVEIPFRRLTYAEAMSKYGSDKPDLRYDLKIQDVTEIFGSVSADFIQKGLKSGAKVVAIAVKDTDDPGRKAIKDLTDKAVEFGSKGLMHFYFDGRLNSNIARFFDEKTTEAFLRTLGAQSKSNIFAIMDSKDKVFEIMGRVRLESIRTLNVQKQEELAFSWVVDFPLFEISDTGEIGSKHHPFTAPNDEDIELLEKDPLKVRSKGYDLVLNGFEIGGGSIRIHSSEIQNRIFKALKLADDEIQERFGFLLGALKFGAPPHGGIAIGVDRLMMVLLGLSSIREMVPFPKTANGQCLMTGAPSAFTQRQLDELKVRIKE